MAEPKPVGLSVVKGKITDSKGNVTEFLMTRDVGWHQWGPVSKEVLGDRVDALDAIAEALSEHWATEEEEDEEEA